MSPASSSLPRDVCDALHATDASLLGVGSFGETWRVSDPLSYSGVFAVKLLKAEQFDPRLLKRETEGLSASSHQGILKLHDTGRVDLAGEPRHVLICEFIDGKSVSAAASEGLPTTDEVRGFALSLLSALVELHSADRIHRDLKPDNIMLRNGDWAEAVIIDFGLSRPVDGGTMTLYPQRVGSIPWMSPEQLRGSRARKAADVWACGVILYQLLTGRHPFFHGLDLREILNDEDEILDLVSGPSPSLPFSVPEDLARTVSRMLTAEPLGARGSARRAYLDLEGKN
ncbi:serine/threonine-protein kinase [Leucobacter tenebrionis]|uniref:serine/threonine-protein kinase n=1 Tax=Leucobacter tenebrionis TaxID=2873270 RepID=UPI001CA65CE0|nr:serine/threonine-protein kinase [Leucobacter tenebrionis]QZY50874.1 serine/threonine protein kinase [Leucobacter tenebrionis]